MKLLCLIPARKNSRRLKNKNFLKINGEMLIEKTIKLALKIKSFNEIIVSSDNQKINKLKNKYKKLEIINRPKNISKDNTPMSDVIKHSLKFFKMQNKKFDAVIVLQPTSPLRKKITIIKSIKKFVKYKLDYLASIKELKHTQFPKMVFKITNKSLIKNMNFSVKNNKTKYYCLDGGTIFIFKVPGTYSLHGKGGFIKVEFPENIDIDTKEDLLLTKNFLNEKY